MPEVKNNSSTNDPDTQWRDVANYEGLYRVSSDGDIYSLFTDKYLKKFLKGGVYCVNLTRNRHHKTLTIARIVWASFRGRIPDGFRVTHVNGDSLDDSLGNLSLLSPEGFFSMLEDSRQGCYEKPIKWTDDAIHQLREDYLNLTIDELANKYNMTVRSMRNRLTLAGITRRKRNV